nr:cytochrome c biogenesis FN, mitochondrial [Tanacetum cinerariifolium]
MLLRRRFAFSSLRTGALVDTKREQAKRVVRNGKKETTTLLFCWIAGANTVVSDQDQEQIHILILTCRWFLTVGILPGSWWAHHELGRGGWWFRDPVENASFMRTKSFNRGPNSTFDFNTFPSSPLFDLDAIRGQPSEKLLPQIHQELERKMEEIGIDLPSGISVEYFTYDVLLGEVEAGVLDPTFLTEVLADLQQPGYIVSW